MWCNAVVGIRIAQSSKTRVIEGESVLSPVEVAVMIINSTDSKPVGWRIAALKLAQLQVRARYGPRLALLVLPILRDWLHIDRPEREEGRS